MASHSQNARPPVRSRRGAAIATANAVPSSCLTCPSVPVVQCSSSKAHLPHVSPLSQPGTRPGIRPVIRAPVGGAGHHAALSCRLSATGIRFLGILFPPGGSAPLTVGLPRRTPASRTRTGFPRSTRVRPGRVGCPLYPGGDGVHATDESPRRRLPLHNGQPLSPRLCTPTRECTITRHQQGFTRFTRPAFPSPVAAQRNGRPLGFPLSFAPPVTSHARQGGDRS